MRLRRLAQGFARAWNIMCAEVHRALAVKHLGQAGRHNGKACEHDWRADAYTPDEPTETGVEKRPFSPF